MARVTTFLDLPNRDLLEETRRLAANERSSSVVLIAALAEVDGRRPHLTTPKVDALIKAASFKKKNGDVSTIINKALSLLIADVERKKLGLVRRPRTTPTRATSRRR